MMSPYPFDPAIDGSSWTVVWVIASTSVLPPSWSETERIAEAAPGAAEAVPSVASATAPAKAAERPSEPAPAMNERREMCPAERSAMSEARGDRSELDMDWILHGEAITGTAPGTPTGQITQPRRGQI